MIHLGVFDKVLGWPEIVAVLSIRRRGVVDMSLFSLSTSAAYVVRADWMVAM